jgi:peptide deformylase
MAVRRFIAYPDKRLRMVCTPVESVNDHVIAIWRDMLDSMYAMPGVGLAANQIGENLRLAVVDCSEAHDQPVRMANPKLLHVSAKLRMHEEGSPNLPGIWAKIERPRAVTVEYMDAVGDMIERDFVGLWATSVQHQIDHLNGKMFFDHLSPVKRKMLLAKAAKLARRKG